MHPVLFKIGSFSLPTFGVLMVLAFFAGMWLASKRAAKYGLTSGQVQDCAFYALIAGVLGARIVFILLNISYYRENTAELLSFQFRGLTSFGGLFFGMAAAAIWARINKVPFLALADLLSPAFLLGHAIGRVGCLMNGCCFGGVCPPNFPIGIRVASDNFLHHPAQIYDTGLNLIALGLVLAFDRRPRHLGTVFSLCLVLHGVARFIYEFWRAGTKADTLVGKASSAYLPGLPITEAQLMALIMIVAGGIMYAIFMRGTVKRQELAA